MPPKPRPQGPKKRPQPPGPPSSPPAWLLGVAGLGIAAVIALVAFAAFGGSGGGPGDARAALEEAGCTLEGKPALVGDHSIQTPDGTSPKWDTDPPTSGPHYDQPAIWGAYEDPVNLAQLVHNLEHGGVFVLYGTDVPESTVAQLKSFYEDKTRGTVLAPQASLGDKIALGAWTTPSANDPADGTAFLATCSSFDEGAYTAFFDAYQFKGPERFPADSLLPGSG